MPPRYQHQPLQYADIARAMRGFHWQKHEDSSRTLLLGNPVCTDNDRATIRGYVGEIFERAGITMQTEMIGREKGNDEPGYEHSRVKVTLDKDDFHRLLRQLSHETAGGLVR